MIQRAAFAPAISTPIQSHLVGNFLSDFKTVPLNSEEEREELMADRNGQKLTDRQRRAIPVLLSSRTISEGCRQARLSRETFYSWLREAEFRKEYDAQSRAVTQTAMDDLKLLAQESVTVLGRLLRSRNETIRYRTATAIIENLIRVREHDEHESRPSEPKLKPRVIHIVREDYSRRKK